MRVVLILLVVLLVPVDALARGPAWQQKRVVVYDYAGPEWQVQSAVNYFNEVLPKHAPQLLYVQMSGPCEQHTKSITVCAVPAEQMIDQTAAGQAFPIWSRKGKMLDARILLSTQWPPSGRWVACHELTHAMGAILHGAWSADPSPAPDACPYDTETMRRLYHQDHKRHR